jgi:hypothetical protein
VTARGEIGPVTSANLQLLSFFKFQLRAGVQYQYCSSFCYERTPIIIIPYSSASEIPPSRLRRLARRPNQRSRNNKSQRLSSQASASERSEPALRSKKSSHHDLSHIHHVPVLVPIRSMSLCPSPFPPLSSAVSWTLDSGPTFISPGWGTGRALSSCTRGWIVVSRTIIR